MRTPKRGMYARTRRLAWRRRARSAKDRLSLPEYATAPSRMAFVSRRSATRRSSFALASVVSILSCRTRFAVKLRSMARLLLVFRSNFRPAFLWRMSGSSLLQPGLGRARPQCDAPFARMRGLSLSLLSLPPFDHLRPVVDLHSEREPHVRKDF